MKDFATNNNKYFIYNSTHPYSESYFIKTKYPNIWRIQLNNNQVLNNKTYRIQLSKILHLDKLNFDNNIIYSIDIKILLNNNA